ncbi:FtsB family cell division protein [Rothia nasimurium]|uniref:FtsB family cell division protein n=1 Tax=Rothia nasimurium TaxID=85336 RepID=UPI001F24852C|nr:septum formation initiator family protein [Rothia nasimurium]
MARTPGKKPNPIAAYFGFGTPARLSAPAKKPASRKPTRSAPAAPKTFDLSRPPAQPRAEEGGLTTPVAAHAFSGHFITLAIVLAVVALTIYNPLTSYIKQSNEIKSAQENIAALEAEKQSLEAQVSWWQDDNFVKQQAKSRLFYVEPGETPYLVVGLDSTQGLADDTSAAALTAPEDSWTTKLWGSVQLAAEDTSVSPPSQSTPEPTASSESAAATESAEAPATPTDAGTAPEAAPSAGASPDSSGSQPAPTTPAEPTGR